MQSLALVIHVLLAVGVIGLVLLQHGKGADAGAAFGSGASATVFGARGSASFLTRATTVLAGLFFVTSITLFFFAANRDAGIRSVTDSVTDSPSIVDDVPAVESDLPDGAEGSDDLPAAPATDDATSSDSDMPAAPAGDAEPVEESTEGQ